MKGPIALDGFTRESRLIRFKEIGPNLRTWGKDVLGTHIQKPIDRGNYPKAIAGGALAALSAGLEAPDYLIAGAVGKRLDAPKAGVMQRTRRDLGELVQDVSRFRLLHGAADVLRIPGSLLMDGLELPFGADREQSLIGGTRAKMHDVIQP